MKILDRYIFQQFVKTFIFTTITFVSLFILINMVENLGDFMDRKLHFTDIVLYYLRAIPETILITSPVSSLLASILVAGRLAGSSELPAIRSAGVSMSQLLYPFLLGGTIICAVNILNSFWVAPIAAVHNHAFERDHLGKSRSNSAAEGSNLHIIEPGNRVVTIGRLNTSLTAAKEISIEEFSATGIAKRIDGESMRYDSEKKNGRSIKQQNESSLQPGRSTTPSQPSIFRSPSPSNPWPNSTFVPTKCSSPTTGNTFPKKSMLGSLDLNAPGSNCTQKSQSPLLPSSSS